MKLIFMSLVIYLKLYQGKEKLYLCSNYEAFTYVNLQICFCISQQ